MILSLLLKSWVGKECAIAIFNLNLDLAISWPKWQQQTEQKHSIGEIKFCIGLSLILKLLVGKRV